MKRLLFTALAVAALCGTARAEGFWNIGPQGQFTYGQFNPATRNGWSIGPNAQYNYFRAPRYPVYAPYTDQGFFPRGGNLNARPGVYGQNNGYFGWGW